MPEKLNDSKWYHHYLSLFISFLCVGPFMLPLVWTHPRFNKNLKLIITLVVLIVSFILAMILVETFKIILRYYQTAY